MTRTVVSLIAGKPVDASATTLTIPNPANLDVVVAEAALADADTFLEACRVAKDAQRGWAATPAPMRGRAIQQFGRLVEDNFEALSALITREIGKPIAESRGEVQEVIDTCNFFLGEGRRLYGQTVPSEMPDKQLFTFRTPVGVAAIVTAGNFPVAVPSWYIVPALVCGNAVVWKPAEYTPATAEAFAQLLLHSGLPEGVFNLVLADGAQTFEGLERALDDGVLDKIGFTGSSDVGRRIGELAGRHLQNPCLELGGKNPLIVLDDADLGTAVECAINGAFFSTGQRCTASSRLIVTDGIHDRFVAAMTERMQALVVDDALKPGTQVGPVVDQNQLDQNLSYLRIGKDEGAKLAFGGDLLKRDNPGFYMAPALFTDVTNTMRIAREEIFGPVAGVIRVRDYDEALDVANDTSFGLASGICTTSLKYASHYKRNAEAGMVMVNLPTAGVDYHVPFGGRKGSSYGPREQGRYAAEFYTTVKTAYTFDGNGPYVPKTKGSE